MTLDTAAAGRARARGDLPRAPGYTRLLATAGGIAGLVAAVALTEPGPFLEAAWGHLDAKLAAERALPLALPLVGLPLTGALLALFLAQVTLGAVAFRGRARLRPGPGVTASAATGLLVVAAAVPLAVLSLPAVLPAPDAGWVALLAPLWTLGWAAALALPLALWQRHRARAAWRRRVAPEPPPPREPDEPPPDVRAAVRRASRELSP